MTIVKALALLGALLPGVGTAQSTATTGPVCTEAAVLPAELSGWASPMPLVVGSSAELVVGRSVQTLLLPTARVRYSVAPETQGQAGTFGGVIPVTIATAGRYRVALGAGAWIDVVRNGRTMPSVAHGHGPACTAVRKMVDFDLVPGRYLVQIAGNAASGLTLMLVKVPR